MIYKVKIIPTKEFETFLKFPLEDEFYYFHINDEAEVLLLFKQDIDENGMNVDKRYSIPLTAIDTVEIVPIYEDNGQKISRC